MTFFRRLFSSDYRAAIAAEAAGDLDLAAERYALAGQHEAAVRVHLARAERAKSRGDEIEALRDALHWAPEQGPWRAKVCRALGEALLAKARAEGVATERDRERIKEAARLLEDAGEFRAAGEAYESLDDHRLAARAYRSGGLVEKMEEALTRDEKRTDSERALREAYADYQLAVAGGDRDGAVAALRLCVEAAARKTEYRRMLDELESRLITGGRVALRARRGSEVTVICNPTIAIGRDPLCDMILRSAGISRRHAEIVRGSGGWSVRDAGSRNGTRIGGLPIAGTVALIDSGSFALGDHCEVTFRAESARLVLSIGSGLDQGAVLVAIRDTEPVSLHEQLGLPVELFFRQGRPVVMQRVGGLTLNGDRIVQGDIQLVHGDLLAIEGAELDVI